ncbi:sugar ABC transporter substrate-binding protein [Chloroflexota bacterium]
MNTQGIRQRMTLGIWPVILVVAGVLLLLHNFLLIEFNVVQLWPLLLVALGLQVLLNGDLGISWAGKNFGITRGSVEAGTLRVNAGELDIQLQALKRPGRLIAGQYTARSRPALLADGNRAILTMDRSKTWWLSLADWQIELADDLPWNLLLSTSLGEITIDLRAIIIENGFIAYITCNQASEFFATMARRLTEQANAYGLDLRVYDGKTDPNEEIIQIELARREGAKAFIVCVVDEGVVSRSLESVAEAGLPLILHNVGNPPHYNAVIVTHDDYELGAVPGRYAGELVMAERNGEANVVILDFPELPSIVERANGLEDGFLSVVEGAIIIGRYKGGTSEFASKSVERLLAADIAFDVILSINDAGAYGAIQALEAANISPDEVIITGVDAEAVAQDYIQNNYYMRATAVVPSEEIPAVSVNVIVKQLAGSEIPQVILAPVGELITQDTFESQ